MSVYTHIHNHSGTHIHTHTHARKLVDECDGSLRGKALVVDMEVSFDTIRSLLTLTIF